MELLFMGTGTSQGVPMIAQPEGMGANPADPRNWRTRPSIHVNVAGRHIQVDAAQEFRLQCIHHDVRWIDTFILTHPHADHILGMDDLRRFCDLLGGSALPVYSSETGLARIRAIYPYAIGERPTHRGYPAFDLRLLPPELRFPEGVIRSTYLPHGALETLGLVFEEAGTGKRLAYFTDCKQVPPEALALARGADVAVLDGLRPEPHPTHMCIDEAVDAARQIGAGRAFLTHMTGHVDYEEWSGRLPEGVSLAYDGLRLDV